MHEAQLPVKGTEATLFGRTCCNFQAELWPSMGLQDLMSKYDKVFQGNVGTFKGFEAILKVDPNATPRLCREVQCHTPCGKE